MKKNYFDHFVILYRKNTKIVIYFLKLSNFTTGLYFRHFYTSVMATFTMVLE